MDTRKINSGIFSEMIDKPSGNDKSIQELLQNIPGGIVMYEWDGVKLKTLHISDYFAKLYGSSLVSQGANDGGPDFMHVHPDDVKAFKEAVTNSIHTTQNLQYVYRVWNDAANRYLWTKISTSSKQLEDGKSIIYAVYTDVTPEVDAKIEAEKNHEILKASIAASGQFCFELDPTDDHMICSPEQAKLFDLPADYIKFPESLFAAGGILEEARPVADELMENLHRGVQETECEVRMYTKGDYLWYRFCFTLWDDPRKGYPIYLCSFSNINDQKVAEEKYRQQLEILAQSTSDALAFSKINLTRNICFEGTSQSSRIVSLQKQGHGKLDLSLAETEKFIMDPLEKEQFHKKFSLSKMMEDYQNGVTHIDFQYHFQLDREHIEWVETSIDLVENPSSHDIEGFVSARNINAQKMEEMILQRVIDRDYKALIYFDRYQDEYMTFDNQTKQYFVMKNKVYENGVELGISYAAEGEKVHLRKQLTKEKVIQELADNSEYVLFYEGADHHKRYELTLSNVEGDNRLVIGALRDVTDEALLEQLTYESEHDLLTGLYNREKCFAECRKLFEAWPEETFVMVHFDIQRFRLYNSFFGEMEGDRLLRYIADMYRNLSDTHKSGVYGRIEADVFLLCFPYNETVIEKNKKYIREYLQKYREDFKVTGNCGLYVIHDQTLSVEAMFNRATLAAKNNKNKVAHPIQFFDDGMQKKLLAEQEIAREMQEAIEEEQFEVYLQPKYVLFSGEAYGAEALVRWKHPQKGMVSPGEFIPLFESNGFITTLDQYMWEHVCRLIAKWIDEGRKVAPISVNVSRVSMSSPQIVQHLVQLIREYKIPIELFNLELTESAYMDNPDEMRARLNELRDAGFSIMMDDFGSGYSSLNTLRDIPVDFLKVDRGFLASVDRDKRSRLVLASVVHMASRMGIPVITEGVETEQQRDFLASIGCDYVQGYLYAKPMPIAKYENQILDKNTIIRPLKEHDDTFIAKITMNMDTEVQAFSDLLPYAVAFVDYVADEFSYLSANNTFQTTFGMHRDVEDISELLARHLTEKNYEKLTSMYRKIARNHCSGECFISWRNNQDRTLYYLVRAQYLGKSAYSTIMITTFIDLTNLGKRAFSMAESAQDLLEEKDIYTMREINSYIRILNQSFDIARLVRPESMQVVSLDAEDSPVCEQGQCYSFWGKSERCKNCTTLDCVKKQENRYKIEKQDNDYYLITSHPVSVYVASDEPLYDYAIETLTKLDAGILESLNEEKQFATEEHISRLQELAYEDPLTCVYNRRYFRDMKYLKDPEPGFKKGEGIAFIMIDLNNFKKINDEYGHAVGDQILIQTADMLRKRVRKVDSVIRYGGDEFLVVLNNCTEQDVQLQIERIQGAFSEIRYTQERMTPVNASMGFSYRKYFGGGLVEAMVMIKEADQSMYKQKREK